MYGIHITLLWWMGAVKINTSLVLSEAFWVWLLFVLSEMLRILTFGYRHPPKVFFKVFTISVRKLFHGAPFDGCFSLYIGG